jgi:3-deoxy-manno-octulosonate cytidylyltransferase (CMP-KDO synthetase)
MIIIPARYASSRYPGKPLAGIRGASGIARPLIERSIEAARAAGAQMAIAVATDDARIARCAERAGAASILTSEACRNGTERVAEAAGQLSSPPDFVVNFQGDALLTPPDLVAALIAHMERERDCAVATVAVRASRSTYEHLLADQRAGRSGGTTVVTNLAGHAMYFSKRVLPFMADDWSPDAELPVRLHLGLYAYRLQALHRYVALGPTPIERAEGLEQLRFLVAGVPVQVLDFSPPEWDPIELNNPTDLAPIEAILLKRGVE